jgi:methionine-rich copper-binding protein CopC
MRYALFTFLATSMFMIASAAGPAWAQDAIDEEAPADMSELDAAPADTSTLEAGSSKVDKSGPLTQTDKIVLRFMELDLDQTAGVSFEEYMTMVNQRAEDRFKSMDANEDGEVTEEEYRTFWQTRKAQWYRLKR